MARGYWRHVGSDALKDSMRFLGFDSGSRLLSTALVAAIYVLCIWVFGDHAGALKELWSKVAASATPLLALPAVYIWKVAQIPPKKDSDRRRENEELKEQLAALSETRPLIFQSAALGIHARLEGELTKADVMGCAINLLNSGSQLLRYKMVHLSIEHAGQHVKSLPWVNDGGFVAAGNSTAFHSGEAETSVPLGGLPAHVVVDFKLEYDTVPPTRVRRMGRRMRFTVAEFNEGVSVADLIYLSEEEA